MRLGGRPLHAAGSRLPVFAAVFALSEVTATVVSRRVGRARGGSSAVSLLSAELYLRTATTRTVVERIILRT